MSPPRPSPGYSRDQEAAGVLGQPQAGQQADGEDEDEEEQVSQPPGRRGRLCHTRPPPHPAGTRGPAHRERPSSPVILDAGNLSRQLGEVSADAPPGRQPLQLQDDAAGQLLSELEGLHVIPPRGQELVQPRQVLLQPSLHLQRGAGNLRPPGWSVPHDGQHPPAWQSHVSRPWNAPSPAEQPHPSLLCPSWIHPSEQPCHGLPPGPAGPQRSHSVG